MSSDITLRIVSRMRVHTDLIIYDVLYEIFAENLTQTVYDYIVSF